MRIYSNIVWRYKSLRYRSCMRWHDTRARCVFVLNTHLCTELLQIVCVYRRNDVSTACIVNYVSAAPHPLGTLYVKVHMCALLYYRVSRCAHSTRERHMCSANTNANGVSVPLPLYQTSMHFCAQCLLTKAKILAILFAIVYVYTHINNTGCEIWISGW